MLILRNLFSKAFCFFFPNSCIICRTYVSSQICKTCARSVFLEKEILCEHCNQNPCDSLCSIEYKIKFCSKYNLYSATIIRDLKYNKKTENAKFIARLIAKKYAQYFLKDTVVLPVNTSFKTQINRGYNVPSLIAIHLEKVFKSIKLERFTIKKRLFQKSQVSLNRKERLMNLQNAFYLSEQNSLFEKDIILLDDVIATGSTVKFLINLILKQKPKSLTVIVFAKSVIS